ncbi:MAG: CopG family transcriptional regulator [Gemmatimonadetes bacterium]|nr:CopG family transcriptional regulator [Gemmatimonadota bacterium]
MAFSITVDLSDEVRSALDEATRSEGVSASVIVGEALKKYFFVRRFRELREETLAHMRNTGQGDLSDEDVFRAVS